MPPRVTRRSAAAKKTKSTETEENELKVDQATEPAQETFKNFNTTTPLNEGLCVVRKLDDGTYEMLNLSSLDVSVLGSMDFGRSVRDDQSGGRLKVLEDVEKNWKSAELAVGQALSSSKLRIFRFMKLPIELRYKIYDYTISSDKELRYAGTGFGMSFLLGLQLRATCRDIYEETRNFFWRNKFIIWDFGKQLKINHDVLTNNLREVSWSWYGMKIKDPQTISAFGRCKQLKALHVHLARYVVATPLSPFQKPQKSWDGQPALAKFKYTNGLDALLKLRDLDVVTVHRISPSRTVGLSTDHLSDEELNAFEIFLRQELTKPKPQPLIKEAFAKASKKNSKSKKKLTKGGSSDE